MTRRGAPRPGGAVDAATRFGAGIAGLALAVGVGACGAAPAPAPAPAPTAPGSMMGGRPSTAPAVPHTGPVVGEELDPAAVTTLQNAVDQGAQPWRLDPQMVALAYVRSRFGWMMPSTQRVAADTVTVDDGAAGAISLHLAQPGRTGTDGIWAVTGGAWLR